MPVNFDTAYVQPYFHFVDQNTIKLHWFYKMSTVPPPTLLVCNIQAVVLGAGPLPHIVVDGFETLDASVNWHCAFIIS